MQDDLIVIHPSRTQDPDGAMMRAVLSAHFAVERAQGRRELLLSLLAILSLPLWLSTAWPAWATHLRPASLAGWALCVALLAASLISEGAWRRKRARLLSRMSLAPNRLTKESPP